MSIEVYFLIYKQFRFTLYEIKRKHDRNIYFISISLLTQTYYLLI